MAGAAVPGPAHRLRRRQRRDTGDRGPGADETSIVLSDSGVEVDGQAAPASPDAAVYVGADIVYYEDGRDETYGEGLHAKNPLARVIVMDNRTQKETVTMQAFSSDIQQVDVIATVNFHVPREACSTLYQRVGLGYYEQVMEPRVQEGVKAVFARYSAEKLIGARSTLADQVMEILAPEMEEYGISVTAVSIENVDFTDAFTDAVEDKQVAEQTKLRTEIEQAQLLVVEQTDAQRRIIAANADAQEREILAEADASVKQIEADAAAYAVRVQAEAEAEDYVDLSVLVNRSNAL